MGRKKTIFHKRAKVFKKTNNLKRAKMEEKPTRTQNFMGGHVAERTGRNIKNCLRG